MLIDSLVENVGAIQPDPTRIFYLSITVQLNKKHPIEPEPGTYRFGWRKKGIARLLIADEKRVPFANSLDG
jgi:hypothetical protein